MMKNDLVSLVWHNLVFNLSYSLHLIIKGFFSEVLKELNLN